MPQHAATFEECLNNGIINIVDSEDEFVEDKSNHQGYIREPGNYFANVALKPNYCDPTYLIPEFAHYLNIPEPDEILTSTRQLLTEAISIFYEQDILEFMAEKSYKKHDLAKIAQSRFMNFYDLLGEIQLELSMINSYKYLGNLSDESLQEARQLGLHIKRTTQDDYQQDIDEYYDILCKRKTSPDLLVGYFIGTIIAFSCLEKMILI